MPLLRFRSYGLFVNEFRLNNSRSHGPTAAHFAFTAAVAFVLVALDPYLVLLFSPILLGAPHALSDIWYFLIQDSGVPRRVRVALAVFSSLVLLAGVLVLLGVGISQQIEAVLLIALMSVPLALVTFSSAAFPAWIAVGALSYLLLATSFPLRAVVAHMHNIIALIFLFSLALPRWQRRGVVLAGSSVAFLCLVGVAVSIGRSGVLWRDYSESIWNPFLSLGFGASAAVAGALLFSYAYLQLMHFAVWIGFVPGLKGDLNFRRLVRSSDFAIMLVIIMAVLLVVLAAPVTALSNPLQARQAYLTLVSFHGWMEIAWLLAHSAYIGSSGRLSLRSVFLFERPQHV